MKFVYHLKPKNLVGDFLIPLNQMDRESKLFHEHSAKYKGREHLMDVIIPKLNCKLMIIPR